MPDTFFLFTSLPPNMVVAVADSLAVVVVAVEAVDIAAIFQSVDKVVDTAEVVAKGEFSWMLQL